MPMEWLDHTVVYRERQSEHYKRISARFSNQQVTARKTVFDPLDPALHSISPVLNPQKINREILGELVAAPTILSAVGKSNLVGVKLILDYRLEG